MASGSRDGRPGGRKLTDWAFIGGLIAGFLALAIVVVIAVVRPGTGAAPDGDTEHPLIDPGPPFAAPAPLPPRAATPGPGPANVADAAWIDRAADATGIPARALAGYAGAALFKSTDHADCGLGWNTLAAIGFVESDHGRHGGSSLGTDGTASPPILGIALDGAASMRIPDSDGGELDGDDEFDRAVGPMQLIPQTWRNWHVDGNGDGVEDPQNIDDAAVAAANYLCRASPDMVDEGGWRAGIAAYNDSEVYARAVASAAERYAVLAQSAD